MAIGNQTTQSLSSLNAEIGQVATDMHNVNNNAREFFERVNAMGVQGLKDIGFAPADAQSFFDVANYMNTSAGVWFGLLAQTPAFPFDDATAKAR